MGEIEIEGGVLGARRVGNGDDKGSALIYQELNLKYAFIKGATSPPHTVTSRKQTPTCYTLKWRYVIFFSLSFKEVTACFSLEEGIMS